MYWKFVVKYNTVKYDTNYNNLSKKCDVSCYANSSYSIKQAMWLKFLPSHSYTFLSFFDPSGK